MVNNILVYEDGIASDDEGKYRSEPLLYFLSVDEYMQLIDYWKLSENPSELMQAMTYVYEISPAQMSWKMEFGRLDELGAYTTTIKGKDIYGIAQEATSSHKLKVLLWEDEIIFKEISTLKVSSLLTTPKSVQHEIKREPNEDFG